MGEAELVGDGRRRIFEVVRDGDTGGRAGGGEVRGVDACGEAIAGERTIVANQPGTIVHLIRHGEGVRERDGTDALQVRIFVRRQAIVGAESHHGVGHPGAVAQAGGVAAQDQFGARTQFEILRPWGDAGHLTRRLGQEAGVGGTGGGAPLAEVIRAGTFVVGIVEGIGARRQLRRGAGDTEGIGEGGGLGEGALIGNPAFDNGALAGDAARAELTDIEVGRIGGDILAEVGVGEAVVLVGTDGIPGVEVLAVGADKGDVGPLCVGGEVDGDGDVGVGDGEGNDNGRGRILISGGDQGGGGGGDGGERGGHGGGIAGGGGAEPRKRAIGCGGEDAEGKVALGAGLATAGRTIGEREVGVRGPDVDGGVIAGAIAMGGLAEDAGDVGAPQFRVEGVGKHGHVEREEGVAGALVAATVEDAEGDALIGGLLLTEVGDHGVINKLGELLLRGGGGVVVRVRRGIDGDFAENGLALVDDLTSGEEGAEDAVIQLDVIDAGEGAGDPVGAIEGEGVLGDVDGTVGIGGQGDRGEGGGEVAHVGGVGVGDRNVCGGIPLGGRVVIGAAAKLDVGRIAAGEIVGGAGGLQGEGPAAIGGGKEGVGVDDGGRIERGGGRGGTHNQVADGDGVLILLAARVGAVAYDAEAATGGAEVFGDGDGIGFEIDGGRDDAGGVFIPFAHERPGGVVPDLDAEVLLLHCGGEGGLEGDGGNAIGIGGGDQAGLEGAGAFRAEELNAAHAVKGVADDAAMDFPSGVAGHDAQRPVIDGAPAVKGAGQEAFGPIDRGTRAVIVGAFVGDPDAGVGEGLLAAGVLDVGDTGEGADTVGARDVPFVGALTVQQRGDEGIVGAISLAAEVGALPAGGVDRGGLFGRGDVVRGWVVAFDKVVVRGAGLRHGIEAAGGGGVVRGIGRVAHQEDGAIEGGLGALMGAEHQARGPGVGRDPVRRGGARDGEGDLHADTRAVDVSRLTGGGGGRRATTGVEKRDGIEDVFGLDDAGVLLRPSGGPSEESHRQRHQRPKSEAFHHALFPIWRAISVQPTGAIILRDLLTCARVGAVGV